MINPPSLPPGSARYCTKCGAPNQTDAAFCSTCGNSLAAPLPQFSNPDRDQGTPFRATPSVEASTLVGQRFIGMWNWGASLLYPLWLITHRRAPLGILCLVISFIPVVNLAGIGAFFYFGTQGNRIAVGSRRFSDEQSFVAVQNAWRNWGFGICLVSFIFLAVASANRTSGTNGSAGVADVAPAPASDPTENDSTPEPAFLANGSEIGGLRYSITDVSRQASVMAFGDEHDASGEFLVVHLTVANVGSKGADISASDFHLKRDDKEYDEDSSLTLDGEFFLEKVNPGTSKSGLIIFDVPSNTAPEKYSLEVYGNGSEGSQDSGLIKL